MNDKQLSAFIAIAGTKSISQAAKELFVSQQSLTYQLKTLEDELGYPLFERTTRGVQITAKGSAFKTRAEQILRLFRDAVDSKGSPDNREVLRVSLRSDAATMILAPLCERFAEINPEVELRLVALTTAEQFRDLRTGAFDVMESPDNDRVHAPGLTFVRVVSSPTMCLLKKADPLADLPAISLFDLHGRSVCIQEPAKCFSAKTLHDEVTHKHPQIERVTMGFNAAQITIASLSSVVVLSPLAFARHNLNPAVQKLVPLAEDFPVDIGLVYAGERPLPVVQKFIDVALGMAGELAGEGEKDRLALTARMSTAQSNSRTQTGPTYKI